MAAKLSAAALLSALLAASTLPAGASQVLSGRYGPLIVAVEDGSVHGLFSEWRVGNGTVDAPQFSCLFLLEGRIENGRAVVETWFPGEGERIAGELRLAPEASLQLRENHGGCSMTSGDMKNAPYTLFLDEPHADWIGAGLVTAERAVLRPAPDAASRRTRPYLVRFDAVAVLSRQPGWIHVEYIEASSGRVTGWLRDDEVATSDEELR